MQTLRNTAAARELELQKDYQAVVERQQGELEALREELESSRRVSGGEAQEGAQGDQGAHGAARERPEEDSRGQARRGERVGGEEDLGPPGPEGGGQQGPAGRATRRRPGNFGARTQQRLAVEDERRKAETWALEERLREATIQRETELRAYTARLKELEAARLTQKSAATEDLEQVVGAFRGGDLRLREPHHRAGGDPTKSPRPAGANWKRC